MCFMRFCKISLFITSHRNRVFFLTSLLRRSFSVRQFVLFLHNSSLPSLSSSSGEAFRLREMKNDFFGAAICGLNLFTIFPLLEIDERLSAYEPGSLAAFLSAV